jgi:hypothetical protein
MQPQERNQQQSCPQSLKHVAIKRSLTDYSYWRRNEAKQIRTPDKISRHV